MPATLKSVTNKGHLVYKNMEENRWFKFYSKENKFEAFKHLDDDRLSDALIEFRKDKEVEESTMLKAVATVLQECAALYKTPYLNMTVNYALEANAKMKEVMSAYEIAFKGVPEMETFSQEVDSFTSHLINEKSNRREADLADKHRSATIEALKKESEKWKYRYHQRFPKSDPIEITVPTEENHSTLSTLRRRK